MTQLHVRTARSNDGTRIAFERAGDGPPLILAVGAFNDRFTGAPLGRFLETNFSVFNYDRRGRGASGDTPPYAVDREIEDLEALIAEAGGSAAVFGYSSGAVLALKAAARGVAITKLVLYEPPFNVGVSRPPSTVDHATQLAKLIAAGQRGDAVEYFQRLVGIPDEIIIQMRNAPFRPALEAMAHTLVYEMTIIGDAALPTDITASVSIPTLVMDGGNSPEWMRHAARALAEAVPLGVYHSLEGQTHDLVPDAIGPVVRVFLGG
jgi:pimeloyl-ACP methyl ester carboxylesterase